MPGYDVLLLILAYPVLMAVNLVLVLLKPVDEDDGFSGDGGP